MEFNNQNGVQGTVTNLNNMNGIPQPVTPSNVNNVYNQSTANTNAVEATYVPYTPQNMQPQAAPVTPYTPENPTNSGVVTNSVQPMTSNVQNVVLNNVNDMAQAQVVQPTTTVTPVQTQTVATNVQPTTVTEPTTAQAVVEPVKQQQPQPIQQPVEQLNTDRYILRLSELKEMVKNACNLAVDIDGITLTSIIQLMFTRDGLIMKSTDNDNILIEKNSNITYNQEISIAVKASLFQKLVSKLTTEYIELIPNTQTRVITLISDEDKFQLTEVYDQEDGQSIDIDNPYYTEGSTGTVFDGNAFKERLNTAKEFTSSANVYANLSGIYCADKVYSTNRDDMLSVPNLPELTDKTMYLTKKFVDAYCAIRFNGETKLYVQKDEEGIASSITICDDTKILSGPTNPDIKDFPADTLRTLRELDLNNRFQMDANRLYNIVDLSTLFVNSVQDKDTIDVEVLPQESKLKITSRNGASDCKLLLTPVNPASASLKSQHFGLFTTGMLNILKNIDRTDVKISIGESGVVGKSLFILYSGDYVALSSMKSLN